MTRLAALLLAGWLALAPGCATTVITVIGEGDEPYCGSIVDITLLAGLADLHEWQIPVAILAFFDLPLSFVADTLLLPYTLYQSRDR